MSYAVECFGSLDRGTIRLLRTYFMIKQRFNYIDCTIINQFSLITLGVKHLHLFRIIDRSISQLRHSYHLLSQTILVGAIAEGVNFWRH